MDAVNGVKQFEYIRVTDSFNCSESMINFCSNTYLHQAIKYFPKVH